MNYNPEQFKQLQAERLSKKRQPPKVRKANSAKKQRQREKIRAWCMKHYGLKTADGVIMLLMKEER